MQYFFQGDFVQGNPIITNIQKIKFNNFLSKINVGQKLYSNTGINVGATVKNKNTTLGTITMSLPALVDGTFIFEVTSDNVGVWHEKNCAYKDAYDIVIERGKDIIFRIRNEQDIERGRYGGRKKQISSQNFVFKSYPITYTPSNKDLEKAGLREPCECIFYIPTKYFNDLAVNYHEIDIVRSTIILDDESFEIKEKARYSQFADIFLYYTFGATRKP